jgi:DNA-binding NarL/FixJ family response regulator
MSTSTREQVSGCRSDRRALQRLTGREREILALVAAGLSNTAIAERLWVMERTVESHITRIFTKLDLEPAPHENRRVLAVLIFLRDSAL